jgi:mono/diheme cytochrome c family protein
MKRVLVAVSVVLTTMAFLVGGCGGTQTATTGNGEVTSYDSFIDSLLDSGASVQMMGGVNQPFFSGQGRIITVNGEDVQVFEYANEALADEDVTLVSPDGHSIGNAMVDWIGSPHFYRNSRLVVIYIGDNPSMGNLLENMLGSQFAGVLFGAYASNGERIYLTAESSSGEPITRTGGFMMMHRLACVTCHGEDGQGGRLVMMMWAIDVPNITWPHLTEEEHGDEGEEHPPFTEESLKSAITDGIEPDGEELDFFMPRWQMADEDLDDLVEYIKTLE